VAPPSSNASRPGRALAVLVALIVVLLLAILGSDLASPGSWSKNFRVHLGLDLTSGTTVELRAVKPGGYAIVATFGPEGSTKCSGLEVVRYGPDSLHEEFGTSFRLLGHVTETHRTAAGAAQQFTYCYCKTSGDA